jgi:1-deoxy-D-xylulose-5-phosphate synthase
LADHVEVFFWHFLSNHVGGLIRRKKVGIHDVSYEPQPEWRYVADAHPQNLPVVFALDRGGLVGADGATHHGAFDLSYLRCIPNLVVMAPSDELECRRMLSTGLALNQPSAVRYPRGTGTGAAFARDLETLPLGKARMVREARGRRRPRVAMLAFGAMVHPALEAAEILDAAVVDMRFVKPLDTDMILELANETDLFVTIEDNVRHGGAGSAVNEVLLAQHHALPVLNLWSGWNHCWCLKPTVWTRC